MARSLPGSTGFSSVGIAVVPSHAEARPILPSDASSGNLEEDPHGLWGP